MYSTQLKSVWWQYFNTKRNIINVILTENTPKQHKTDYKNICKSWLRRKKYGVFYLNLNLIFMTFRREYGISTSFYLLASLLYKPIRSLIPSLIRCTEEWNYHYEVIMSLTDAAVIFGPFNESFISLRNMDRFCVNLQTNIISNVKDSEDGIWL